MLIRLVVSNFLSFKEETEFNMLTGSFKIHKDHIIENGNVEVLKGAAIYGSNGAGKSNLVKAFAYLKNMVLDGKPSSLPVKHKASSDYLSKPTSFEIEFFTSGSNYSYGLVIDNNMILEEWLVRVRQGKDDETIFKRVINKGQQSLEFNERYLATEQDRLRIDLFERELVDINKLFLTFAANLRENKIVEITEVYRWIEDKLIIIFPESKPASLVPKFLFKKKFHAFSNNVICGFETGITRIDTETIPLDQFFGEDDKAKAKEISERLRNGEKMVTLHYLPVEEMVAILENDKPVVKKLYTIHAGDKGQEVKFELYEESEGTQRLLDFIPALYAVLFENSVVIIDEIDKSIHPHLSKSLVAKVMGDRRTNGQLIFTTHESNLLDLDIFRQDEIWFAEKDKTGETHLYSMSEFKPRYDLDVRKGYLNGRFGAIAFLGNLVDLKWEEYAEEEQGV